MDLKGAVALVTAGNGGLGQRICYALAKQGGQIAFLCPERRVYIATLTSLVAMSSPNRT
jgi:NAD(P)-dependent dehydrogenase (short-subunit alcohol dehydrogenase family)